MTAPRTPALFRGSILILVLCIGCGSQTRSPDISVEGSPEKLFDVTVVYGENMYPFGVVGGFGKVMAFGPVATDDKLRIQWVTKNGDQMQELDFSDLLLHAKGVDRIKQISFQHHGNGRWTGTLTAPDDTVIFQTSKTIATVNVPKEGEQSHAAEWR